MDMEESLRQLASCSICLDVVADQKQLPCQHNVCVGCMLQLAGRKARVPCPVCKKNVTIPTGGVRKLPDCMLIKQMADLLSPQSDDWTVDPDAAEDFGLRMMFGEEDCDASAAGASGGARNSAVGLESGKQKDKRANYKVFRLMNLVTKQLSSAKVKVAEKTSKLARIEGTINRAISEIRRSCDAKILSLEHSKLVHCEEIKSELDQCSRRVQVYEQLQKDLLTHSTIPTEGYSAEQKSRMRQLEKKLASLYKTSYSTATSEDKSDFKEGDRVRILPNPSNTTLAELMCGEVAFDSVGIYMKRIEERSHYNRDRSNQQKKVWVMFPEKINWVGDVTSLCRTNEKAKLPFKGDKVKVLREQSVFLPGIREDVLNRSQKRPAILVDVVSDSSSTVDSPKDVKAVVQFANCCSKDKISYEDVDFFTQHFFKAGDIVRIDSTIEAPSQGWGRLTGSSVGTIKVVATGKQTSDTEVIVVFEEDSDWTGVLNDLELWVSPSVGDKVQVKLSVREPYLKWGGVTHTSRGTLEKITNDLQLGKVAEIKIKDRAELFKCLLSEIELARYESPDGEVAGARGGINPDSVLTPQELALGYMMASDMLYDPYTYPRYDDDYADYDDDDYDYDAYDFSDDY